MEQDLREMFKKEKEGKKFVINKGHEERFLDKLNREIPKDKKYYKPWLGIAASLVVLISIGFGLLFFNDNDNIKTKIVDKGSNDKKDTEFTFGDLSPDLKKVENYYVANINIELAKLEVSPDTKDLIDSFMEQLNNLNLEYKTLNLELKELGPNDQTITIITEIKEKVKRIKIIKK